MTAEEQAAGGNFLLQVSGIVKEYPGVRALDGVSMEAPGGTITGLLGKNGAGKSTLIKALAGVVQPDDGEITINGEPTRIASPAAADSLGFAFVHQELADFPNLSVAENVLVGRGLPSRFGFVNKPALRRAAKKVLDRLEADIDPAAPLSSLSIAERRLVMIGHGLAADARMLVLDEPTASLTETEIDHLHRVLRVLRDEGVAIVYVSHRLDEVAALTDRVTVMRDGQDVFHGATAGLSKSELIVQITGHAATETRPRLAAVADTEELLRVEHMTMPGVIEDASFELRAGELLGIAGLVGAGRTELMRLVYGADHGADGTVYVHGKERKIRSPRDGLNAGLVLLPEDRKNQGAVLKFSVRKNITLPQLQRFRVAKPLPVPNQRNERRAVREVVDTLHIKVADVEAPASHLSGGNQQKMVLARWLESRAEIFIFDEPTHGIDVDGKEEVYQVMTELAQSGKGVIFISSEFNELVGACNRVLVMREGRIVGSFEGEQITESALVASCYSD
jgi:ABC-type sugar transport system ATPase subunit